MLFPPFNNIRPFIYEQQKEVLPYRYEKDKPTTGNRLFYLQVDNTGYIVYNGKWSEPMIAVESRSWEKEIGIGEIVAGSMDENGFFLIQKIGEEKWLININNTTYKELDGVGQIYGDNCFFDGKELVFYGLKGFSVHQFKIKS